MVLKKFVFSLITTLIILACVFTGCTNGGNTDSGDPGKKPSDDDKKITFTVNINKVNLPDGEETKDPADISATLGKVKKSVVKVIYENRSKKVFSASGIVIGKTEKDDVVYSFVLTSLAFVEECMATEPETDSSSEDNYNPFTVISNDGETEYVPTFIGADPDTDVFLMYIKGDFQTVDSAQDLPETGERIYAIGHPLSLADGTVTSGIVSGVSENFALNEKNPYNEGEVSFLQTDALVKNGSEGGGLFASNGAFVGLVTKRFNSYIGDVDGLGIAVSSEKVASAAQKLIETYDGDKQAGYIPGRVYLGYKTKWNPGSNPWGSSGYVSIVSLDPTGCFSKWDFVENDVIKSIKSAKVNNGIAQTISKESDLRDFLVKSELVIGDRLTITYTRGSTTITKDVVVEQYVYGDTMNVKIGTEG